MLLSLGITRGKAGTLLSELFEFKRLYDRDVPLRETPPRLVEEHTAKYADMTLRALGDELHALPDGVDGCDPTAKLTR